MKVHAIQDPWKLLALKATNQDGTVMLPFGDSPTGMIYYGSGGYMFYIAMRWNRRDFDSGDMLIVTP